MYGASLDAPFPLPSVELGVRARDIVVGHNSLLRCELTATTPSGPHYRRAEWPVSTSIGGVAGTWVARVNEVAPWAPSAGSDGFEVVDVAGGWHVKAHAGRTPSRIAKVLLLVFVTRVSGYFWETRAEVG